MRNIKFSLCLLCCFFLSVVGLFAQESELTSKSIEQNLQKAASKKDFDQLKIAFLDEIGKIEALKSPDSIKIILRTNAAAAFWEFFTKQKNVYEKQNWPMQKALTELVVNDVVANAFMEVFERKIEFAFSKWSEAIVQYATSPDVLSAAVKALEIYSETKKIDKLILRVNRVKIQLGYMNLPEFQDIGVYYKKSINVAQRVFKKGDERFYELYLGYANHLYGIERDLESAEEYFKKAGTEYDASSTEINLSLIRVFRDKNDKERALEYCMELKRIEKSLTPRQKMMLYTQMADIYTEKGDLDNAGLYIEKANAIEQNFASKIEPQSLGYLHNELYAKFYALALKRGDSLNITAADVLRYGPTMGYNQYQYIEAAISILAKNKKYADIDTIKKFLFDEDRSRDPFRKTKWDNQIHRAIAAAYIAQGKYTKALIHLNEAIFLLTGKKANDEMLLESISEKASGIAIFKEKLKAELGFRQQNPDSISLEQIHETAVNAVVLLDKMRQSLTTKGSKELLLNDAPWVYEQAIQISHQLYNETKDKSYLEEAFTYAEKNKAVLLLDALKEDEARRFGEIPDSLLKKEQALLNDIDYYSAEKLRAEQAKDSAKIALYSTYLFQKRAAHDKLKKQLEQDYARYFELKYNAEIASSKELQEALKKEGLTLLEYTLGKSHLYIFMIDENGLKMKQIELSPSFSSDISNYYKSLTDVKILKITPEVIYKDLAQYGRKLQQLLLVSILGDKMPKRLLIIPDGILSYIAFEPLICSDSKPGDPNFGQLDYLIKHSAINYNYSATLWLENYKKKPAIPRKNGILAMASNYGNVNKKTERGDKDWKEIRKNLGTLHGAQQEVKWLKHNFKGKFLFDGKSSEADFLRYAPDYAVLHLAMHGVINEKNSSYSGLFFTDTDDTLNDDILFAYEVPSLNISAELVVLSACQTGYGKYQNGEGVVSLGRSFMYAGASSLVMTLWEVNDQSAKILMESFYSYLSKGLPKDEALSKAKLDYLKKADDIAAHPYLWANFVLVGNVKPMEHLKPLASLWVWALIGLSFLALITLGFAFLFGKKTKDKNYLPYK